MISVFVLITPCENHIATKRVMTCAIKQYQGVFDKETLPTTVIISKRLDKNINLN